MERPKQNNVNNFLTPSQKTKNEGGVPCAMYKHREELAKYLDTRTAELVRVETAVYVGGAN